MTRSRFSLLATFSLALAAVALAAQPSLNPLQAQAIGAARLPAQQPFLGLRLATLTPELQERLQIPSPEGVDNGGAVVTAVIPGSPAELAGIPTEAVLMSINLNEIQSPADVVKFVNQAGVGAEITLKYAAFGEILERKIRLEALAPSAAVPPASATNRVGAAAVTRIESLERRIDELERRLRRLESQSLPAANAAAAK
jgi:membrane-associated protease RseP (regulator of RpoE activity)